MNEQLKQAVQLLKKEGYTCVWVKNDAVTASCERGVKPLLQRIDSGKSLEGFYAADKVVGKGAAMLYIKLKPAEVYACVISEPAKKALELYNIPVFYETCTENISNRTNTGICPMEEAVLGIDEPDAAIKAIRDKLKMMNK